MAINDKYSTYLKKIKFLLVFFSFIIWNSCVEQKLKPAYKITYENGGNAVAISFHKAGFQKDYSVKLKGNSNTMLGNFTMDGQRMVFSPVIPFTEGKYYEVFSENELYFEFSIQPLKDRKKPSLLAILPKLDTVPENLLKMYFKFDVPMQQTQPTLDFIQVIDLNTKKEASIFLPLENELWNRDKTQLTLWLDPGRIKKDLIPNKEKGIPIQKGHRYRIKISQNLRSRAGATMIKEYQKEFYVHDRDEQSPDIQKWKLTIPMVGTREALGVEFGESLDPILVDETLKIFDKLGKEVEIGLLTSLRGDNTILIPAINWKKGSYNLVVESRLEDLAGNNLNRLFDVDLRKQGNKASTKTKKISFTIR